MNRNDNHLSLCLEQAAHSPLHYRHGAIIVRGGKVIGSGFNDHRAGFDGGALKTGQLRQASKQHGHSKHKPKSKPEQHRPFVPFENLTGALANTPISMHSEMMALMNALAAAPAASTAKSTRAFSSEKPCFKLPGGSKRTDRLRGYVERVCREVAPKSHASGCTGKLSNGTSCVQRKRSDLEPARQHRASQQGDLQSPATTRPPPPPPQQRQCIIQSQGSKCRVSTSTRDDLSSSPSWSFVSTSV